MQTTSILIFIQVSNTILQYNKYKIHKQTENRVAVTGDLPLPVLLMTIFYQTNHFSAVILL